MKHCLRAFVLIAAGAALAACSTATTDRFVSGVQNFVRGVEAVDEAAVKVNATILKNCRTIQATAQAASDIAGSCSKASSVVTVGNEMIRAYCQAAPGDIASTATAVSSGVSTTKYALAAAKKECGS